MCLIEHADSNDNGRVDLEPRTVFSLLKGVREPAFGRTVVAFI